MEGISLIDQLKIMMIKLHDNLRKNATGQGDD